MTTTLKPIAEQKCAFRTALFFVVVVISAEIIAILHESAFRSSLGENHLLALRLFHIGFSIIVLTAVLTYGDRLSARVIQASSLLLVGPGFPLTWLTSITYSQAHIRYSALLGYKLIFLVLSLAPGPLLPNAVLVTGFAIEAVAVWYFGGVRDAQLGTLTAEPWVTLLFACASILILIYQSAYRRMHRQLGELTVRQRIIENLSGLSLSVRDKVNSPLQTLEICFARLPKNEVTAAGRKSLNTIADSIRSLREFDCLVDWEQKEFPEPETLVKRLREDLEKQEVAFHLR
jgi:hypothetical protein